MYNRHVVKMILESAQLLCTAHHELGNQEYKRRYGRTHLTIDKCRDVLMDLPPNIPSGEWIDPPQCMPDEYKADDAVEGYWNYYINEKQSTATSSEKVITQRVYE